MSLCCAALLLACGERNQNTAIPRPKGYPRVAVYDAVYTDTAATPVVFPINARAEFKMNTTAPNAVWADVVYSDYRAKLAVTFTRVDEANRDAVVSNRTERMALNLGANEAEQIAVNSAGGYESVVLTTVGKSLTPVQFLSSGTEWVVSGAMVMDGQVANIDSVLPIIETVRRDVLHAVANLK